MLIQSKFKDYYDWVAKKYGGGDPRIVYERGPIRATIYADQSSLEGLQAILFDPYSPSEKTEERWRFKDIVEEKTTSALWFVVCGKLYLALHPRSAIENLNDYRLTSLDVYANAKRIPYGIDPKNLELGKELKVLIELCRIVGHPVFACRWRNWRELQIMDQCPILGDIGFPAIIPAEQMYQELSYFMGNLMLVTPDTRPPVEVSNKQKIIKAGFDPVASFRHRK